MNTRQYYDEFSAWYERHRHDGYHAFLDEIESDTVRQYLRQARQRRGQRGEGDDCRLLEAGCGTGLVLRRLIGDDGVGRGGLALGLDLSAGMLARARGRGLSVVQGSVTRLPFADATFDVVCSFKVLAHVEDIEQAVAEFGRVLRPGGHLVAEFYNPWSLRGLIKRLKPPSAISERTDDEAVYTRYDDLARVRVYLAQVPGLRLERVRGLRVLTPVSWAHRLPIVGPALRALERVAADAPLLRRLGGFLIVVARKEDGP